MHRMLSVHEILSHILGYCNKLDLAAAGLVSRFWNDVALDYLWREIKSVFPLLKILCPLMKTNGKWQFAGTIPKQNWDRFQSYARRIRRLSHNDYYSYKLKNIPRESFSTLLPTLVVPECVQIDPLLPSIVEINWSVVTDIDNLSWILPFISPSLKILEIDMEASDPTNLDAVRLFFDTLTGFAELDLQAFKFERSGLGAEVLDHLLPFLKQQQNLKALGILSEPYVEPRTTQGLLFPNLPNGLQKLKDRKSVV